MDDGLKELQKWVYDVITHPQSVAAGAQDHWHIESIVAPSETLNSYQRINIYRDSYFLRLLDVFKNDYKGLKNMLGDELFDHFAWSYLQLHPSTSYTLNELGKRFPEFLQKSLEESLDGNSPDDWQLFIIDIARYERTYIDVFHGEGHEEIESKEPFPSTRLRLSPSVTTLQLNFPVAQHILSAREESLDALPDKETVNYVFTRDQYRVHVHSVSELEFKALDEWIQRPDQDCPTEFASEWKLKRICFHEA